MKISVEKMSAAAIILLMLACPLLQTSRAAIVNSTEKDKVLTFLRDVICLNLAKYNITNEGYSVSYPSNYGGIVKEETYSFILDINGSKISVMGIFDNGFIYAIDILPNQGPLIYTQPPSTNVIAEARNILQRYQIFTKNYGMDTSHLATALSMLSSVTDLTPSSAISGNMKQEISSFVSSDASFAMNLTSFKWVYTANGVDAFNKRLEIDFEGNAASFRDTWELFTIGSFSVISEDEARSIGWEAAKSFDLRFRSANGTLYSVVPEWSDLAEVKLNMIPGQIYNRDPRDHFVNPGNATRDPLALYPLWQMVFYFSKSIGGAVGVQVGVWGDTKEIAYISEYGYLGAGDTPTTPTETSTAPTAAPSEAPTEPENSNPSASLYITGVAAAVAITVTAAALALKKRSK